ncbi:MAG: acylase [Flaviaesturariibacter sp.]|nr:acylase [Flaviaesturariibacter sp.]
MKSLLLLLLFPFALQAQKPSAAEIFRYKSQAKNVTIIQDKYGIPHIYGKTDADAVFGLMYTQCEQNFARVERNYLEVFGRLAEIDGEGQVMSDVQMQLIYDSSEAKRDYQRSPAWLKKLCIAFADGINYYLATHPNVKPAVLKRFEPWFPLMYTDGSISATQMGDLTVADTRNLYSGVQGSSAMTPVPDDNGTATKWSGSNGFAVAPSRTASGNSILYINPHVTFYFRSEVQLVSEEGLNVYGAVTWGNFFVYQGFNEHCGWMHTSSYADVADVYEEKITKKGDSLFYEYNGQLLPVKTKPLSIRYKKGEEAVWKTNLTGYYTIHGPVIGSRGGKWLSLKEHNRSLEALEQSWLRTKAKSFAEFKKVMDMRVNNSNNTVYADAEKNIAYWHGNFMPVRDPKFDWSLPVDGSTSATDWKGMHTVDQTIHIYNPGSGFIQNCNSTPFTAAGASSPKKEDYPAYMAWDGQNPRAINASRLLSNAKNVTLDSIIGIGYSHYLAAFETLLPSLFTAYNELPAGDSLKAPLSEAIELLRRWDYHSSASSVATTVAVEWATRLTAKQPPMRAQGSSSHVMTNYEWILTNTFNREKLLLLRQTLADLEKRYGTWRTAWGEVNRYQRNAASTNSNFDDSKPSMPVGLASAAWGSLPSFNGRRFPNTNKRYGVSGNSFVAAVEFGKKVKAKTIMTGGESFNPASPHFTDQAEGFINGKFKEALFYKEDVLKGAERTYHPGE